MCIGVGRVNDWLGSGQLSLTTDLARQVSLPFLDPPILQSAAHNLRKGRGGRWGENGFSDLYRETLALLLSVEGKRVNPT